MRESSLNTDRKTELSGAPVDSAAGSGPQSGSRPRGERLRSAIVSAALAPFRVHHYRDLHSRMLRDALYELDCGRRAEGGDRCA